MSIQDCPEQNNINTEEQIRRELGEYVEAPWTIIESYFRGQHLRQTVRH